MNPYCLKLFSYDSKTTHQKCVMHEPLEKPGIPKPGWRTAVASAVLTVLAILYIFQGGGFSLSGGQREPFNLKNYHIEYVDTDTTPKIEVPSQPAAKPACKCWSEIRFIGETTIYKVHTVLDGDPNCIGKEIVTEWSGITIVPECDPDSDCMAIHDTPPKSNSHILPHMGPAEIRRHCITH